MPRHLPWPERFWNKVNKTLWCWEWTASCAGNNSYGRVHFNGRDMHAHRVSWIMAHGPIPPDKYVLHKCDNPICVRPEHLFLGTQKENMADCVAKGRYSDRVRYLGHRHPLAKLTPAQVVELRALVGTCTYRELGHRFGIDKGVAFRVAKGKSYKEVALCQ